MLQQQVHSVAVLLGRAVWTDVILAVKLYNYCFINRSKSWISHYLKDKLILTSLAVYQYANHNDPRRLQYFSFKCVEAYEA